MKIRKISIAILCMVSFFACEKESSDSISNERATLENQKIDPTELARNFDKQLPPKELIENANAYTQLDHEEMGVFIDERQKMSLEEGATIQDANAARQLTHKINNYLKKEYNQSYASAAPDEFREAYDRIIQNTENTNEDNTDEKFLWGGDCDSWYSNKLTYVSNGPNDVNQKNINLKGEYKYNGQGKCYYVYQSTSYSSEFQHRYIYGKTPSSYLAMTLLASTQLFSKEVSINSYQKSFEFIIEKWRIEQAYPDFWVNGKKRFAEDTKIEIVPK